MIHDKKSTAMNSLLAGVFFQSLFAIQNLFLDCWSEDVRTLIWKLRLIAGSNEDEFSNFSLLPAQPVKYLLSIQKSNEKIGLISEISLFATIEKLEPIDRLVTISNNFDSLNSEKTLNPDKQTMIGSIFTGAITPDSLISIKNWNYK